jgi:hypothetical protein
MLGASRSLFARLWRVRKNLGRGLELAWSASPASLVRYSLLGMLNAAMPPLTVYLGAQLVDRIVEARTAALSFSDMLPLVVGLWLAAVFQRGISAYTSTTRTGTTVSRAPSATCRGGRAISRGPSSGSRPTPSRSC